MPDQDDEPLDETLRGAGIAEPGEHEVPRLRTLEELLQDLGAGDAGAVEIQFAIYTSGRFLARAGGESMLVESPEADTLRVAGATMNPTGTQDNPTRYPRQRTAPLHWPPRKG